MYGLPQRVANARPSSLTRGAVLLGKKIASNPSFFPVASAGGRRYTGARAGRPDEHLGQNVDSLHILPGRPWRAGRAKWSVRPPTALNGAAQVAGTRVSVRHGRDCDGR